MTIGMTSLPSFEQYLSDELEKGHPTFQMDVSHDGEHPSFSLTPITPVEDESGTKWEWIVVGSQLISMATYSEYEGHA